MHRTRAASLLFIGLLAALRPVPAQRAFGFGGDAATLPAGLLRLSLGGIWDRANERYGADGKLRTLGITASPWNGAYDVRLAAAAPLVSSLAGMPGFDASLGALLIARRDASADLPIAVELGVHPRLTVGARIRVASHAIEPSLTINPRREEGNVGFNPGWTSTAVRDRNAALVAQIDSAAAQTARRIAQCQSSPAGQGCAPVIANVAAAQALVASAGLFASTLGQLYGGRGGGSGMPFVPVHGGAAQRAIDQRVLGYRDQFSALGNSVIGTQGLVGAALFSAADVTTLLTDSLYGFRLRPLRAVHAYGLGEIAVHAKARLFDNVGHDTATIRGFALRQSAGAALRLSGGAAPAADEPYAPVAGAGGTGLSVHSYTDAWYGARLSVTIVAGVELGQAQEFAMRVPPRDLQAQGGAPFPFVSAEREVRLSRTPGSRLDLAVTPRVALTDNIWLGAGWSLSQQAADVWDASAAGGSQAGASRADAAAWAAETDWSEQRVVLGGTYSTVAAVREGRAQLAFDVSYEHHQTVAGRGWRVAHVSRDAVLVRWYPRVWGR